MTPSSPGCSSSRSRSPRPCTRRLQADLRRAGIQPFGWVINASLVTSGTAHPTLRARAAAELAHIERVQEVSGRATWLVGWQPEPPVGVDALRELATNRALSGA